MSCRPVTVRSRSQPYVAVIIKSNLRSFNIILGSIEASIDLGFEL